jgi:hypothetical protein
MSPRARGAGYDRLRIDVDNNNDLTDHEWIGVQRTEGHRTFFKEAPFTVRYKDGEIRTVPVSIGYAKPRKEGEIGFFFYTINAHLEGELEFNGRKTPFLIHDGSWRDAKPNACFHDLNVDRLGLDLNGDGKIEGDAELQRMTKLMLLGDKVYEISTAGALDAPTIGPSSKALHKVSFAADYDHPCDAARSTLRYKSPFEFHVNTPVGRVLELPEGEYGIFLNSHIHVPDADGKPWTALVRLAPMVVRADAENKVHMGKPIVLEPVISGKLEPGGTFNVNARVHGAAGERYSYFQQGNTRLAPHVKVWTRDDKVLIDNKMGFG